MIHLFIEFCDHHRLNGGQQFGHGQGRDAERVPERERGRHVPAGHRTGLHAKLAAKATDEVPDLPAFKGGGAVQPRRAVLARLRAGLAVAVAPTEGPFGKGAEAFFS